MTAAEAALRAAHERLDDLFAVLQRRDRSGKASERWFGALVQLHDGMLSEQNLFGTAQLNATIEHGTPAPSKPIVADVVRSFKV